jgi:hypothetical protein
MNVDLRKVLQLMPNALNQHIATKMYFPTSGTGINLCAACRVNAKHASSWLEISIHGTMSLQLLVNNLDRIPQEHGGYDQALVSPRDVHAGLGVTIVIQRQFTCHISFKKHLDLRNCIFQSSKPHAEHRVQVQ